jgi:hypothetical protein
MRGELRYGRDEGKEERVEDADRKKCSLLEFQFTFPLVNN